jgi:hypothetical protein
MKASPAPQYEEQRGWEAPPGELNEMQRLGFRAGVAGAHHDFDRGNRPDVNDRDEYRRQEALPRDVPYQMREVWRDGFRRGYAAAAAHLWNSAPQQQQQHMDQPQGSNWEQWGMRGLQSDAQRRGYHDGGQDAQSDFQRNRRPDPDSHGKYQNPEVPPQFAEEYREGFMRGYTSTMSQLSGEPSWQQYNGDPSRWEAPSAYSDMKRRGFHDGIEGAQKDFGNHRHADPNNRDEYRNPNVPGQFRGEYREGFRRGYEVAAARLWGGM